MSDTTNIVTHDGAVIRRYTPRELDHGDDHGGAAYYFGHIDINTTGQPFVDGNEVWAHVGWVDPATNDVYGLAIPTDRRDRITHLRALYISLGTRTACA